TIESASLKAVSKDPEKDPGKDPGKEDPKPTPTPKPDNKPNNKPAEESKYESDTSGSTSAVDSSTTLKDGTYTPDSFAFSGGTGKVNITCPQITVKNGKAFATLVFSSSSYQYVKANGNKYNTSKSGSTASVTIPVELNKNNTIIGMTTKMSAAHEIQYSIFIYLAAADGNKGSVNNTDSVGEENKLDDKAPEILGLKAIESDKEVKSDYLKIFEYEGGIKLVEIAMTKDTVLDPELVKKEEKTSKKADQKASDDKKTTKEASASAEDAENPVKPEQTLDEVRAELYQQDVVKYLVVPKGADIPAGLDKQVIVINLPVKSTYASSVEAVSYMDQLNLLSNIKAVGFEKEDCENKNLKKAMEEEKAVFAGSFDKPKAKEIVKQKTDLVLESDELLPLNESVLKDRASDKKNVTDEKDVKAAKENEKLSTEDYRDRMTEITDRMAALNIPMLIDRSADEKTELGKAEWIRLYGILFNCEDEAEKLYEKTVSEL
ncbi:MAG: hypothetical protein MJ117_06540, partial [Lachnospiraceae bacterium]|nr:hypothetical protein [Lachnospiraceae bacterium]